MLFSTHHFNAFSLDHLSHRMHTNDECFLDIRVFPLNVLAHDASHGVDVTDLRLSEAHPLHLSDTVSRGLRCSVGDEEDILALRFKPLHSFKRLSNLILCLPYDAIAIKDERVVVLG